MLKIIYVFLFLGSPILHAQTTFELVKFKSQDGLEVAGNLYMPHPKTAALIILFHQAGYSRGEYLEIAPRLNALGYNCLAVDLRSGGKVNGVDNITHNNARTAMRQTNYLNSLPDMLAAVDFAKNHFTEGKLILWGSSYTSSLVLKICGDNPDMANGVLSFSPGEYFSSFGESDDYIETSARNIDIPVFITSAKSERGRSQKLFDAIDSPKKVLFIPETAGKHGSSALWSNVPDSKEYWEAVEGFLKMI